MPIREFRFWCQKVLPLVYDDSLSYYEVLNKMVDYINKYREDLDILSTEYLRLTQYVNDYFDNLDVQEEVNNVIQSMVDSGAFEDIVNPLVVDATSEWLEDNVTPTGSAVLVDSSLSISGAAADAKVTGDEIGDLKSDFKTFFAPSILAWHNGYITSTGDVNTAQQFNTYYTDLLPIGNYVVYPKSNRQIIVAYYNRQDGTFVSRSNWSQSKVTINEDYFVKIGIGTVTESTLSPLPDKTPEEVLANIDILCDITETLLDDFIEAMAIKTAYVETGWESAQPGENNYYVRTEHINFSSGDTVTALSGYQIAILDGAGSVEQAWTSSYTFNSDATDYTILIRRTNKSAPIDKSIDGLTLLSYIKEVYTSNYTTTYILNDHQLSYIGQKLNYSSKWRDKKVAFVGDSITAGVNTTDGNIYYQLLNAMVGFSNVYADGVAGSCYSVTSNYGSSITPITSRWSDIPTDRDLVIIFAGTNDYGHNTPLGTIADTTDISFYGALSVVINGILESNPDARLVLFTPLHRYNYTEGAYPNDTSPNGQGHALKDYVDAIKDIAELYGVPVIDLFSTACLNPRISAIKTNYVTDGLHPNAAGHYLLAKRIAPLIETV